MPCLILIGGVVLSIGLLGLRVPVRKGRLKGMGERLASVFDSDYLYESRRSCGWYLILLPMSSILRSTSER